MIKLPSPNDPSYESARSLVLAYLYAIGAEEPGSRYTEMADDLAVGDLMQIPTWIALGLIALQEKPA